MWRPLPPLPHVQVDCRYAKNVCNAARNAHNVGGRRPGARAVKLTGTIDVAAPPRTVWDHVVDPTSLASCVPGARDVRPIDERTFDRLEGSPV